MNFEFDHFTLQIPRAGKGLRMRIIKIVPLAEAVEGMVLATDVCDEGGQVLLSEKTGLTAARIASLAKRGVGVVQIEEEKTMTEEEVEALRTEVRERVERVFRHAGDDAVMMRLKEVVQAYRLQGVEP